MFLPTIDEIKEKVAPIAQEYAIHEVVLFGSYARGEADEASDIDLMVDLEGSKIVGLMALTGLKLDLEETLGKPVDLLTKYQADRAESKQSHFFIQYKKDRRKIYA